MRVLLASGALFAAVSFAGASAAQDGRDAAAQPAAYRGPFLSWAGKASAPAVTSAPASQPQLRPQIEAAPASEPLPPPRPAYAARTAPAQSEYSAWPAPSAAQPQLQPQSQARVEYIAPSAPYAPLPRSRPERPTATHYIARPTPQAAQSLPRTVQPLPKTARAAPPAVQPRPMAAEPAPKLRPAVETATGGPPATTAVPTHRRHASSMIAPTPSAVQAQAAPIRAPATPAAPVQKMAQNDTPPAAEAPVASPLPPTGAHYYSLHRAYGLTPDHVDVPKDRPMVLIGPADGSTAPGKDDSDDSGKSDKHGDSNSADD